MHFAFRVSFHTHYDRIFLAFSNFMEMHSIMVENYRIGTLTMKVCGPAR